MRLPRQIGTYTWRPADSAQAAGDYHVTAGGGRLDLTGTAFAPGSRTKIGARVGVGDVRVTLPPGILVEVHASTRFGDVVIEEELRSGPRVDVVRTLIPEPADEQGPRGHGCGGHGCGEHGSGGPRAGGRPEAGPDAEEHDLDPPTIELTVSAFLGDVEVRRAPAL